MGFIAGLAAQPIVRPVVGGGRRLPRNGLLTLDGRALSLNGNHIIIT